MAVSPGYRPPNMEVRERNKLYDDALREFSMDLLLELMRPAEAALIDDVANGSKDVLRAPVPETALICRFNRATYDDIDGVEDYICASDALMKLIELNRAEKSHESSERVRLLRSARACIFIASLNS